MHRTGLEEVRNGRPWLWTALAAIVVVGTATWVMRPQPVSCRTAAPTTTVVTLPAPSTSEAATTQSLSPPTLPAQPDPTFGEARFYAFDTGVACSLPDLPLDGYYVGVSTDEYDGSAPCGSYVDIDGPLGSVRAQVVDRCPGCAPHQYDLSRAAFEEIADPHDGVAKVRINRVRDPNPAPELYYRVQQGSSRDWLGLLFSGGGNPIGQVALLRNTGGEWIPLRRGYDNYWSVSGAGAGPFTAAITDAYGNQVLVPDVTIASGQLRYTGIRLYDIPDPEPAAPVTTRPQPVVVTTVIAGTEHCDS